MKKLLVLPGNSPHNKEWTDECKESFASRFDEVYVNYYDHWETGENFINFETEINKIKDVVGGSDSGTTWHIYAKSVGTLLTLKLVAEGVVFPSQCLLFGMPLELIEKDGFSVEWKDFADFKVESLAFHNVSDPVASCDLVTDSLEKYDNNIELVTLGGNNHDYLDFSYYQEVYDDWMDKKVRRKVVNL